jgi:nitroimidazol reductase NimA-like FMN-containing flavoprotein (pyridoxamine 5'-phosphate oxidase superfamily)
MSAAREAPVVSRSAYLAGDFARRVVHRRNELGLSREKLAKRADMDEGYLGYLEGTPHAALSPGTLMRLAAALETTLTYLAGGTVDRPLGAGRAGPHPQFGVLTTEESMAHLEPGGIGRLVLTAPRGPVALPVNFRFVEGDIVFRTDADSSLAAAAGALVSFEVDHIDEVMSEGWSVLVSGQARRVDAASELERLVELGIEPWAGGARETVLRIETTEISGRNIRQP